MRSQPSRTRRNEAGFTLVELMVTVSIIGVLAAVAIPRYIAYVRASQTAEVGQTAGAIVSAVRAFADAQSLAASDIVTRFNNTTLLAAGETVPTGQTDIRNIMPQLNVPPNASFNYTLTSIVATAGEQVGEAVYCIRATGRANAGVVGGIVLYSSANAAPSAAGWEGRINRRPYIAGETTTTNVTAGGYCDASGVAKAT